MMIFQLSLSVGNTARSSYFTLCPLFRPLRQMIMIVRPITSRPQQSTRMVMVVEIAIFYDVVAKLLISGNDEEIESAGLKNNE